MEYNYFCRGSNLILESLMERNKLSSSVSEKWIYRIHSCLLFSGLMIAIIVDQIIDVDDSKVWPLALGAFLSMLLPITFGSIRNKSIKKGYLELVESNYRYGQGSYRASFISINAYCLAILLLLIWAAYQSF